MVATRTTITCILSCLALASCVSNLHVRYSPDGSAAQLGRVDPSDNPFAYQRTSLEVGNETLEELETPHYRVHHLHFTSVGDNGQTGNQVTARYYEGKSPGAKRVVIILPIWGSYTYPSDEISADIRKRSRGDTHVLQLLGENYLFEWDALANAATEGEFVKLAWRQGERVRVTVVDIRRLIDWAESRPEIDSSRIGLVGFSMGAIVAAMLQGNEPRLAATVSVMGAADPGEIFATCPGRVTTTRDAVMARFGWTREQYRDLFREVFERGDPVRVAGRVNPERVLIIDAFYDQCMPGPAREALWEALGQPERISFRYGHKMSFLAMTPLGFNYMRREIYGFLDRTLDGLPVVKTSAALSEP